MATLTEVTTSTVGTSPATWTSANSGDLEVVTDSTPDADYAYDATNASGSFDQGWLLDTLDSDFESMTTVYVNLRYATGPTDPDITWDSLDVRIVRDSDGTWIAGDTGGAFINIASGITNTAFQASGAIQLTSINSSTNDALSWADARVEIRITKTRSMGGGDVQHRVSALSVTGTYVGFDFSKIAGFQYQLPQPIPPRTDIVPY